MSGTCDIRHAFAFACRITPKYAVNLPHLILTSSCVTANNQSTGVNRKLVERQGRKATDLRGHWFLGQRGCHIDSQSVSQKVNCLRRKRSELPVQLATLAGSNYYTLERMSQPNMCMSMFAVGTEVSTKFGCRVRNPISERLRLADVDFVGDVHALGKAA
jgi:hypothetical protein